MGAPNVKLYAPTNKSVININDFKSPKELADFLKYLDSNDTAYEEYLSWKKTGYSQSFKKLVDLNAVHSRCRLCIKLIHNCDRNCPCGRYPRDVDPGFPELEAVSRNIFLSPITKRNRNKTAHL
eukprot:TRINITY_DN8765_c0_g1_i1.p1 TRINITY_DN8765_c0_g1~~TRINITY_DN8765_c0_g1_i1.p1  ORF type:complete len:124 (-),score=20.76 TRINITY_DN8765_c0_g1_i1:56-427(-)